MKNYLKLNYLLTLKYFYILLIITYHFSCFAQKWPSLFDNEDFIPLNATDLKKNKNITPYDFKKMEEADVRKKIFDSFYFIADFASSIKEEEPRNWFDSHKNPAQSLIVGFPPTIKRPTVKIHFPVYNLTKLAYFKADDKYTSKLNMCQEFWLQNRLQNAYDCFFFLQLELANDKVSIESIIRMNVNILHGFFLIFLSSNDETNLHIWNANTVPPSEREYSDGDHYSIARSLFSYITTRMDDTVYFPTNKEDVIDPIYKSIFNSPTYFKLLAKISGEKVTVSLLPEPVDPLAWIRTVMPIVYADAMAMNQGWLIWQRAFTSAGKMEEFIKKFNYPSPEISSPLIVGKNATARTEIFMAPKNNTDLLATIDLFRAVAMVSSKDPTKAIEYIASGISRQCHPDLVSLLFTLSGDIYFDLDILRWARRSYSWSELYNKDFIEKAPASIFFGAESAYWQGQYDIAKRGYERFIKSVGDPEFGPWARLRIAEIAELNKNMDLARTIYEVILKNFDRHPASQDAQVRLFCMYEKKLTRNVKKVEYKKVLDKIKDGRDVLKKQAKACLLNSDLVDMSEKSKEEMKKTVVEKAQEQKDRIEIYRNEFPNSEFLVLFSQRLKELELAEGTLLAEKNECLKLIDYYNKNRKRLLSLEKNNHKYVYGLKWDDKDKTKLLRCSAFLTDLKIWKEMRKTNIGHDGKAMHEIFYSLTTHPSVEKAIEGYQMLKSTSADWGKKVKFYEGSAFEMTDREDFWELLTLQKLLKYEFVSSVSVKSIINSVISRDLLSRPEKIFETQVFCNWMLRMKEQFNDEEWDTIATAKTTEQWINLIFNEKEQKSHLCDATFAKTLLAVSITRPTLLRDKSIFLPYLDKKGIANGSEEWLRYVQRLERMRSSQDIEVQGIYKKIAKEAKDKFAKESAQAWINKNIDKEVDKLLW
ncbi:tetratricopeptide repeat protein [Fluviispira vulneris]|uniref:tetratricopeptide repeat protein n=1 Tax=Fluviispira vulneris TaxID=2763012 RepID=UPI001648F343|nr:tetratricopeptide repeat protein [Fluviispira vulneris]